MNTQTIRTGHVALNCPLCGAVHKVTATEVAGVPGTWAGRLGCNSCSGRWVLLATLPKLPGLPAVVQLSPLDKATRERTPAGTC